MIRDWVKRVGVGGAIMDLFISLHSHNSICFCTNLYTFIYFSLNSFSI